MLTENEEEYINSVRIYDGKILNLRLDTVKLGSGNTALREVVEHHGAIAVVPVHSDGSVTLVRQYRTAAQSQLLEVPAGSLNEGESAMDCAHRELGEETNLQAGRLVQLFDSYMAPGYSTEIITYFLATDLSPFQGHPDDDESLEIVYIPLTEAVCMIEEGQIRDAKSICALLYVNKLQREGTLD